MSLLEGDLAVSFFKLMFVLLAFLYLMFAFVVTRQIKTMRTTLITPFSSSVRVFGYVHFLVAAVIFLAFVFFL
jgi:hypothetical protein